MERMDNCKETWTVVQFLDDHSVEAVPSSWLDGDVCHWPPFSNKKLQNAIKNQEPLNTHWTSFRVKVFRNATYDDYHKARQKSKIAEDTSDLATSDCSENNKKAKRKVIPKVFSSSDSEGSEDSDLTIPKPPSIKKKPAGKTIFSSTPETQPLHQSPTTETPIIINKGKDSQTDVIVYEKERDKLTLKHVMEQLHILKSLVIDALQEIREIKEKNHQARKKTPDENFLSKFNHLVFPITKLDQFNVLEEILTNEQDFNLAVNTISKIGGTGVYNIIKRAMATLLSNDTALEFSFYGRKGKKPFNKTKTLQLLIAAVERNHVNSTSDEIEKAVGTWLRRASDRRSTIQKKFTTTLMNNNDD